MSKPACLREADLLAIVTGEPATAEQNMHLASCAECRRRVRRLFEEVAQMRDISREQREAAEISGGVARR